MSTHAPLTAARSRIARWIQKLRLISEVNSLDPATRGQLMNELHLSEADLDAMAELSLSSDGLERVLELLGVDRAELERDDPALMSELRRSCTMCKDWKACSRDLDARAFSAEVEDYCVNSEILRKLVDQKQPPAAASTGRVNEGGRATR